VFFEAVLVANKNKTKVPGVDTPSLRSTIFVERKRKIKPQKCVSLLRELKINKG
jgi:hypothetical protein